MLLGAQPLPWKLPWKLARKLTQQVGGQLGRQLLMLEQLLLPQQVLHVDLRERWESRAVGGRSSGTKCRAAAG